MLAGGGCLFGETLEYDPLGRLARIVFDDGSSITYLHDTAGNRLRRTVSATPPESEVGWSAVTATTTEADGTVTLEVQRTGTLTSPATVFYSTYAGTAFAGADFLEVTEPVSFAAGEAVKQVVLTLVTDTDAEPEETFLVTLHSPGPTTAVGSGATATVTIETDPGGTSGSPLDSNTVYGQWAAFYPVLQAANEAGALQNPDGDPFPNFVEYAFGLDPTSAVRSYFDPFFVTPGLPRSQMLDLGPGGPALELQFLRRPPVPDPGISYVVEFSGDLATWLPVPPEQLIVIDLGNGWEQVIAIDSFSGLRRYGRVRVLETPAGP